MDNLETLFATAVNKDCGNASGSILERLVKSRASTMFGQPSYSLDGPGLFISLSGPHEEFSTVILVYG